MIKFKIGDKVKISPMYLSQYEEWGKDIKDKIGTVIYSKSWKINGRSLHKDDKAMYQSLYGVLPEYELYELMVDIDNVTYLSSQFGVVKINDE